MAKQQQNEQLTVYAALLRAREEFPTIVKDETADVGKYKYKYVELSSVLAAVTPALTKHGLILVQTVDCHAQHGPVLLTRLVHIDSGTDIQSGYPLQPDRPNDPQALGKAVTYARRYSIFAVLGLAPEDDDAQKTDRPARQKQLQKAEETPDEDPSILAAIAKLGGAKSFQFLKERYFSLPEHIRNDPRVVKAKNVQYRKLERQAKEQQEAAT